MRIRLRHILGIAVLVAGMTLSALPSKNASALSGSQFDPSLIMSDAVFYHGDSLTPSNVQAFLNSKVPSCDTNGDKTYTGSKYAPDYNGDGRIERWERGKYAGYPAPYICLRNYQQNTPAKSAESGLCGYLPARSGRTAANIIVDVASACGVNPKVLIVLLQKEQTLVTDDWPWSSQYQKATGFACPDTAPCNTAYYGFFNQVYHAARQFKRYRADPTNWNYVAGQSNKIYYNPNSSCGYSWVTIKNQATAGLYDYTPYQPNQAALNNLYGSGNSCSAYGNRNFWRYYNDWFGSTTATPYSYGAIIQSTQVYSDAGRTTPLTSAPSIKTGQKLYFTVTALNTGDKAWDQSFAKVGTAGPRDRVSEFCDSSSWLSCTRPTLLKESSVVPGQYGTFEFSVVAPKVDGTYSEDFQLVAEGKTWFHGDASFTLNLTVSNPYNATITQVKTYSDNAYSNLVDPQVMANGQKVYVSIKAKNTGNNTWNQSFTRVGTFNPKDRSSVFQDGSWLTSGRPAQLVESTVAPGQTGTFQFSITAPGSSANGDYTEAFGLVAEGYSWMPAPSLTIPIKVVQSPLDRLYPGYRLYPSQRIQSSNSSYTLASQSDGNLVLYSPNGAALWKSSTRSSGGAYLTLQSDGNLVLYSMSNRPLWHTRTYGTNPGNLVAQSDGNLVLLDGAGNLLWESNTVQEIRLATATNSKKAGEALLPGQEIVSTNGQYRLHLQSDGNLVERNSANKALWASWTMNKPITSIAMQGDGNFVAYGAGGKAYWHTHTFNHPGALIMLRDNGNLTVYDTHSRVLWTNNVQ